MAPIPRFAPGLVLALLLFTAWTSAAAPQDAPPAAKPAEEAVADAEAERRILEIFAEIPSLEAVDVEVRAGVARLRGRTVTAAAAERAEALAAGVAGVVTVENEIERDVSLSARVSPAVTEAESLARRAVRLAPLLAIALMAFAAVVFVGELVARWTFLWRRIAPNPFLVDLARATVRVAFFILAAIAALSLLDAAPLLGAVLGAAGVLGLAIGFGLRDVVENYIASVLLSIRQPFRPDDHVLIDGREGRVARLTPRATILVTLDGNQLRMPNAAVFKATIVNYTANPQRRFDFDLMIDADKDPVAAVKAGREALSSLPFVLKRPPPAAIVARIEAKTTISFSAWIDQRDADFAKSRSIALTTVKQSLDMAFADRAARPAAAEAPALRLDASPEKAISQLAEEERLLHARHNLLTDAARSE